MSLVISLVILGLLIILFVKELKTKNDKDVFMNMVIPGVAIIASLVNWYQTKFSFKDLDSIVYIFVTIISIAYVILFFVRYSKIDKTESTTEQDSQNNENNK